MYVGFIVLLFTPTVKVTICIGYAFVLHYEFPNGKVGMANTFPAFLLADMERV
jgi:hypothetical protein